jgi:mono/diheme cytochrome c family protein
MNRVLLALLLLTTPALAEQPSFSLKAGAGKDLVSAKCVACHSLDYIQMNSPFLDHKGWENTVAKMINVMGANISPEEARVITQYLAEHYGAKKP